MNQRALLSRLADLIVAVERLHPVRVAIDGAAAAGKSTLADALVGSIQQRGRPVIRASLDGFHRPRAERYRRGHDSAEGYYHDAFDFDAIRTALIAPLGPGGDRRYRLTTFDYRTDSVVKTEPRTAPVNAVLLCEGMFLLRPELDDGWDYRIFVHVDDAVAVRRASERDQELFGDREAAERRYWTRYVPAQRIYLELVQPCRRADVVVDNNHPLRPRLVRQSGRWY